MRLPFWVFFLWGVFLSFQLQAQQPDTVIRLKPVSDSVLEKKDTIYTGGKATTLAGRDSAEEMVHKRARRAALYSAILPGAGQVYNKKYWKVPLVYAALGIPAYYYFYNKKWYQNCQYALTVTTTGPGSPPRQSWADSAAAVAQPLKPFVKNQDVNGLITNRDEFRKNEDYAVIYFLLFYVLNIVDATVDAHLKGFNVNSDLSFKLRPMFVPGPYGSAGISVAVDLHKARPRALAIN